MTVLFSGDFGTIYKLSACIWRYFSVETLAPSVSYLYVYNSAFQCKIWHRLWAICMYMTTSFSVDFGTIYKLSVCIWRYFSVDTLAPSISYLYAYDGTFQWRIWHHLWGICVYMTTSFSGDFGTICKLSVCVWRYFSVETSAPSISYLHVYDGTFSMENLAPSISYLYAHDGTFQWRLWHHL